MMGMMVYWTLYECLTIRQHRASQICSIAHQSHFMLVHGHYDKGAYHTKWGTHKGKDSILIMPIYMETLLAGLNSP